MSMAIRHSTQRRRAIPYLGDPTVRHLYGWRCPIRGHFRTYDQQGNRRSRDEHPDTDDAI